jgi:hypothetical protein
LITLVSKDAKEDQWTVVQWQDGQGEWHDVTGWQGNFDEFIGEAVGAKTWAVVEDDQFGTRPFRWQILQRVGGKALKTSDPFKLPTAEGDIVFVDA